MFGAGVRGKRYVSDQYINSDTIAILDNNENLWGTYFQGISILNPKEIYDLEYDYIVISVVYKNVFNDIKKQLISLGVSADKIISCSEYPEFLIYGFNNISKCALSFLGINSNIGAYIDENFSSHDNTYCGIPIVSIKDINKFNGYGSIFAICGLEKYKNLLSELSNIGIDKHRVRYIEDLIKYSTNAARFIWIENCAKWINEQNLEGSVAECGVNTGDSAKFINEFFPNRKLYLFDTFEGFSEKDIEAERKLNNDSFSNSVFNQVGLFNKTSIDVVMNKMNYHKNVVVKKGYFPDSAKDICDKFCFVNLDMDLYQPMLNGLHFFWDKMVFGGGV